MSKIGDTILLCICIIFTAIDYIIVALSMLKGD